MHSKYFEYDPITKKFNARSRPSNQSTDDVLIKLSEKITNLQLNPAVTSTPVNKKFMYIFKKSAGSRAPIGSNSIDICHGVSIANIMKLMVEMMNQKKPLSDVQELVIAFEHAMLNGSDNRIDIVSKFIRKIRKYREDPKKIMNRADTLALNLNCAPNNLAPGTKSVNCSIGADNDSHLIRVTLRDGSGYVLCALPTYTAIKNSFSALAQEYGVNYTVEDSLSKSSALNVKTEMYDDTLFEKAVRKYVDEETGNLSEVIASTANELHAYDNPLFEDVCNYAETLANASEYATKDEELLEHMRSEQYAIGYEQAHIDHKDRYGYSHPDYED